MIIVHSENSLSALSATVVSTSIDQGGVISSNKCYPHMGGLSTQQADHGEKEKAWSGADEGIQGRWWIRGTWAWTSNCGFVNDILLRFCYAISKTIELQRMRRTRSNPHAVRIEQPTSISI